MSCFDSRILIPVRLVSIDDLFLKCWQQNMFQLINQIGQKEKLKRK